MKNFVAFEKTGIVLLSGIFKHVVYYTNWNEI